MIKSLTHYTIFLFCHFYLDAQDITNQMFSKRFTSTLVPAQIIPKPITHLVVLVVSVSATGKNQSPIPKKQRLSAVNIHPLPTDM